MELKKYKHEAPYSYTLGMAPTLELIQYKPDAVDKIYVHPEYTPRDEIYNIFEVCKHACLPCEVNKKIFDANSKPFSIDWLFSQRTIENLALAK